MTYTPHTPDDVREMLKVIGVSSVEDLFSAVPEKFRFPQLDLPQGLSQMETAWELEELSNDNLPAAKTAMFLGAGAYHHYSPPVVNHMILRGEFLTAYTPY
jgi:glycine cleavage system P protein (glycine dehydrogenase) subunit 1